MKVQDNEGTGCYMNEKVHEQEGIVHLQVIVEFLNRLSHIALD